MEKQIACRCCGKCCLDGGPALHQQDLEILREGVLSLDKLITIRQGELVRVPFQKELKPAATELVKISGRQQDWTCVYFDREQGCTIYQARPFACRALKCWDMDELLAIVEKETLTRFDILPENDPLLPWMREHELACSCSELRFFLEDGSLPEELRPLFEQKVRDDLRIRQHIVSRYHIRLEEELFRFGRPLFQQLAALGVRFSESINGLKILW